MIKRSIGILSLIGLFLSFNALAADTYTVDASHSSIGFSVKHMLINNVKGHFGEFAGTIVYNPENASQFKADGTVQVKSINTGIAGRDEHLRGPDFFEMEKYPEIVFAGKKVEKQGDVYQLTGDLTMHGVTREITLPVTISGPIVDPYGKTRIGLETTTVINRKDYGINWSKVMDNGGLVVADEVKAEINIEAVKE